MRWLLDYFRGTVTEAQRQELNQLAVQIHRSEQAAKHSDGVTQTISDGAVLQQASECLERMFPVPADWLRVQAAWRQHKARRRQPARSSGDITKASKRIDAGLMGAHYFSELSAELGIPRRELFAEIGAWLALDKDVRAALKRRLASERVFPSASTAAPKSGAT